ncbi:MAG: DUF2269 family protein [Dehalococcoidia bacterium]
MSTQEVYLYGHLLGVFLLLAAAGISTASGIMVARVTAANVALTLLKLMRFSEYVVTSAGAVLIIVFGILLVNEADFSMGDPWISAAFTLLIIVLGIDHGLLMPRAKKAAEMAEALGDGPVSKELSDHLNNPVTIAAGALLDISFLIFLWLMIAKPGA